MDILESFQYDEVVHELLVDCMKNNALIQEYIAKEEFYKNSLDASNQTIEKLKEEIKNLQLENKSLKVLKSNEQELLDRINELNLTVQKKDLEIQSMQNNVEDISAQITNLAQLLKEKSEYPHDSKKQVKQNDDTKEAVPDLNFLNTENNSAIKQNEEIENNRNIQNIQNSSNIFQYESDSESTPAQNSPSSIIFEHTIDLLDSSVHKIDFDSAKLKVEEIKANQSDSNDSDDELEDLQERNNSTRSSSLSLVTDSTLENFDREHKSPDYIILSSNDEIQANKSNEEKKKSKKKSKNKKKKKTKPEQKLKRKRTDSSDSLLPDLRF